MAANGPGYRRNANGGIPRWVKVLAIAVALVVLLVVIAALLLTGGDDGGHVPRRH